MDSRRIISEINDGTCVKMIPSEEKSLGMFQQHPLMKSQNKRSKTPDLGMLNEWRQAWLSLPDSPLAISP